MPLRSRITPALTIALLTAILVSCSDDTATLLIKADEHACTATIDGDESAELEAYQVDDFPVGPGEHLFRAESLDGYYESERKVQVDRNNQKVVNLKLHPSDKLIQAAFEGEFEVRLREEAYMHDNRCQAQTFDFRKIPAGRLVKIIDSKWKVTCGSRMINVDDGHDACYVYLSSLEFQQK